MLSSVYLVPADAVVDFEAFSEWLDKCNDDSIEPDGFVEIIEI